MVKGAKGKPETVDGHFNKWHIPFDATTEASKYEYARKVCAKLNLTYDEALKLGKMWPGHHSEWQISFTFRTQRKEYTEAYAVCRKYNLPYSEALKKKEEEDAKKAPKETQSLITRTEDVSHNSKWKIPFPALGGDGKQTEDYRVALAICHKYQLPYLDAIKRQQEDLGGVIRGKEPETPEEKQPETKPRKGHTERLPIFHHVRIRTEVVNKDQPGVIGIILDKNRSTELGDRYRVGFGTSDIWISHENLQLWVDDK